MIIPAMRATYISQLFYTFSCFLTELFIKLRFLALPQKTSIWRVKTWTVNQQALVGMTCCTAVTVLPVCYLLLALWSTAILICHISIIL